VQPADFSDSQLFASQAYCYSRRGLCDRKHSISLSSPGYRDQGVRISFPHRYQVHQASERFLLNFALAIDQMHRNLQKGIFPRIFSPCYASKFSVSMISASTISAAVFPASMLSASGLMHFISILSASLPVSQLVSTPQAFSSPHLHRTFGGKLSDPCDAWNVCCEAFELRRFAAFATFPFRHFALRTFSLCYRSNLYLSCMHRTIFSVTPAPYVSLRLN
jgi:hypothetical protein